MPVAVVALDTAAMFVGDALDGGSGGLEFEGAGGADSDPVNVGASLFTCDHTGLDHVSGLEPVNRFGAHEVSARKAGSGDATHT